MSEQSPERQEKPKVLTDDCDNCKKKYQLKPENTEGQIFDKQPECNFLLCVCPHCSNKTRIFTDETGIRIAIASGITIHDEDEYAPEPTYSDWLKVKGITLVESHELTNRHEALVHKFGETLLALPNELLMDGFESEHSRPYPERWV